MLLPLKLITIQATEDILLVHDCALQLVAGSSLDHIDQIRFAARLCEECSTRLRVSGPISIQFSEMGKGILKVEMLSANGLEREFLQLTDSEIELVDPPLLPLLSRKQLEYSLMDMRQFTCAISHDLKNSLTKLKLALSLVEEEEIPAVMKNYLQIIQRSASRLENTMLDLNKVIELGYSSSKVVHPTCIQSVFEDVKDEFIDNLEKVNATVVADFNAVTSITYPEVYLKSILSNLMSNAIKYRSASHPLEIRVQAVPDNGAVKLVFSDTGTGIDMSKHADKLFMPFTRFSDNTEGSGLGLYMIRNMVERNGGTITVESERGKGTTFYFHLREYEMPKEIEMSGRQER